MTLNQFMYGILTYFLIGIPLLTVISIICFVVFKLLSTFIDKEFEEIFDIDKRYYH